MKSLHKKFRGRTFLVVGAGSSLLRHKEAICNLDALTIGINNMTSILVPDFHLWTNNKRYRDFGGSINPKSRILLGNGIVKKQIRKFGHSPTIINYEDRPGCNVKISKHVISGYFRTAGCLAIALASYMGAGKILVAGMDGYTFIDKSTLDANQGAQHVYGEGHTDNNDWEECVKKDEIVRDALRDLRKVVKFEIITPTVFKDFYNEDILCS